VIFLKYRFERSTILKTTGFAGDDSLIKEQMLYATQCWQPTGMVLPKNGKIG